MQRVPRKDGVKIWKISNRTLANLPELYQHFGYRPLEEKLSRIFPDVVFLGWYLWQWIIFLALTVLGFLLALVLTWGIGFLIRRGGTEMNRVTARFVTGPARVLLWLLLVRGAMHFVGPSVTIRAWLEVGFLLTIALVWSALRLMDIFVEWMAERFRNSGREESSVLLRPIRNASKIAIVLTGLLLLLDNMGYRVSTILAGLGVGGLAVALAAQDTLKNLLGSIMILGDRPYTVGQRIVAKGHDGIVEDIGLRSTKLRLLNGHQTTVPNDEMSKIDIENISRRPHIRRLTNLFIPLDTPADQAEKAVKTIQDILQDHEKMDSRFPPRVYFNEFNRDCLNIQVIYWYHSTDYWNFQAFNQRVNLQIMRAFEAEGIPFAVPSSRVSLAREDGDPPAPDSEKDPGPG
jgi:MscS family membrane protein